MPCSHRVLPSADLRHNGRTVDVPAATVLSGAEGFGMVEIRGIRLRRDNWVSVRYAEKLNSGKSSVLLQRADRHGILGEKPPDFQVSL